MMMGGNQRKLAVIIAGGPGADDRKMATESYTEDDEEEYSSMGKEALGLAMKKFISAVKEGDSDGANEMLMKWCDIYKDYNGSDMNSKKENYSDSSEGY